MKFLLVIKHAIATNSHHKPISDSVKHDWDIMTSTMRNDALYHHTLLQEHPAVSRVFIISNQSFAVHSNVKFDDE